MKRRHHCKSSHAKVTLAVLALCGMTAFWGSAVWAADAGQTPNPVQDGIHYFSVKPEDDNRARNYNNDGAVGTDSLAVGAGAYADGTMGATALGNDAVADGERALAVGNGSKATGLDAIAIGTGSQRDQCHCYWRTEPCGRYVYDGSGKLFRSHCSGSRGSGPAG